MIAVSIVSHGHGAMVDRLVESLLGCPEVGHVFITRNIPEVLKTVAGNRITIIDNPFPKGFGANHNAAYKHASQPFFCPLNPDIELHVNPFPELLSLMERSRSALAAPLVKSPEGEYEDSMRRFPTISSLFRKLCGGPDGRYPVSDGQPPFYPEWVAGMFMLFRSPDFARLNGFDERFFLYYEDVDICVRAWKMRLKVVACPQACIVHDAQRASRRSFRHLRWHLASMGRYFWKHWRSLPDVQ